MANTRLSKALLRSTAATARDSLSSRPARQSSVIFSKAVHTAWVSLEKSRRIRRELRVMCVVDCYLVDIWQGCEYWNWTVTGFVRLICPSFWKLVQCHFFFHTVGRLWLNEILRNQKLLPRQQSPGCYEPWSAISFLWVKSRHPQFCKGHKSLSVCCKCLSLYSTTKNYRCISAWPPRFLVCNCSLIEATEVALRSSEMQPLKEGCRIFPYVTIVLFLLSVQNTESRLVFELFRSCTYEYELAVHTARGSQSTASTGFRLSALVRIIQPLWC